MIRVLRRMGILLGRNGRACTTEFVLKAENDYLSTSCSETHERTLTEINELAHKRFRRCVTSDVEVVMAKQRHGEWRRLVHGFTALPTDEYKYLGRILNDTHQGCV